MRPHQPVQIRNHHELARFIPNKNRSAELTLCHKLVVIAYKSSRGYCLDGISFQPSLIRSMGNDGGSIPTRRELVKNAARAATISEMKATLLESQGHAWSHCALSGDPLDADALVSDWRGRLYNYEAILKALMPCDEPQAELTPDSLGIKSLRDVVKLKVSREGKKWVCPMSMKQLGPTTKAVYLVPCGHVFADIGIKEIKENVCPECSEVFTVDNIVVILPTNDDEVAQLKERRENLQSQGLTHGLKKAKSEKKKKRKGDDLDKTGDDSNGKPKEGKADSRTKGINNDFAATITAKVLAEQDERNKRRKIQSAVAR